MKIKEKVVIAALLIGSAVFSQTSFGVEQTTSTAGFLLLSAPPETRVKTPSHEMPEHAMSRATLKNIENKKNEPVRDPAGNIQYVVTVTDSAPQAYAKTIAQDARFANWHAPEMVQVLHDLEHVHGFSATHLFSQTLNGFAAYLSESQVASLRKDARVRSAEAARKLEFSAGLWNDYTYGNEILPWGVQAVGGRKVSSYGATVYAVDSGIGYHPDINVVDRWAAPGASLVGRYAHSTHVAGIIGAIGGNSTGTIGVNSATKIVSLAVGDGVDKFPTNVDVVAAFEEAKNRIRQSGRVGVVNLSMNKEKVFDNLQTANVINIVGSIRSLIAPNATTGYRGAFLVQAAGNQNDLACKFAFNDRLPGDGAMVVGALDYNGQPLRMLNGHDSIINSFGSEPGSNYGNCVDAWAPGNKIYSAWFDRDAPSPTYAMLSGTSMAAPHVAGIAAWLIESRPWLQTPADVESAVRSVLLGNGANDTTGLAVRMPNLDGVQSSARPTVEFKIADNFGESPSVPLLYTNQPFNFSYDSAGASSCYLRAWINGSPWYAIPNFVPSYNWGSIWLMTPGQYRWEANCTTPAGTSNSATADINVVAALPNPSAVFYVDGVALASGTTISRLYGQAFTLSYGSANADACDLSATLGYLPIDFPAPWYSVPNFYTSYNWGAVSLQSGRYAWTITCRNSAGAEVTANLQASIN